MASYDSTFTVIDDGVELDLSDTKPTDKCIVLTMEGPSDRSGATGDDAFLMVGLTAKQARKLGVRLIEQAGVLR